MADQRQTYQDYGAKIAAIISDGIATIPLWAVTSISLNQTYHLPPIGSKGARAIVATHDDTINLSGLLVGDERFTWKLLLETLAETSKRGTPLGAASNAIGLDIGGLVLITSMTIRTDMQIQNLSFSASSSRRDVLEVSIAMMHMPRPSGLHKLLDVASLGVAALMDA
jgi:hypothetical protein